MRGGWFYGAMLALLGAYGGGAYLIYDWSTARMAQGPRSFLPVAKAPLDQRDVRPHRPLRTGFAARAVRPSLRSVQVEPDGDVLIRGHAEPSSALVVLIAGRELPAVRTGDHGEWSAIVKAGLPAGSYTLGLLAQLTDRPTPIAGDLVRVDLPDRHPEKAIVTYRGVGFSAPAAQPEQRTLFPERRIAQAPAIAPVQRSRAPYSDEASFIHDWWRQAAETYRRATRKLSVVPLSPVLQEVRAPVRREISLPPAMVAPRGYGMIDTAWSWYGRITREYDFVIRKLSQGTTQVAGWQPARSPAELAKSSSKSSESPPDRRNEKRRLANARRDAEAKRIRAERRARELLEQDQKEARRLALLADHRRQEAKTRRAAEFQRQATLKAEQAEERRRLVEAGRIEEALLQAQARDARRRVQEQARLAAGRREAEQAVRLAAVQRADARRRLEARAAAARRQAKAQPAKSDGRREAALRQAKIAMGIAQEAGNLVAEGKPNEGLFLASEAARQAREARQMAEAGPFSQAAQLALTAARKAEAVRRLAMVQRETAARKPTLTRRAPIEALAPAPARKVTELRGNLVILRERADAALRMAERAGTAMGVQKIDKARWLAAGAVREAEAVRKGATAHGAKDAARTARDARSKARAVLRLAVSQHLEAARRLEALRRGPPSSHVLAQPVPRDVVPKVAEKDTSALHLIAAEAIVLARQARKLVDDGQSNAARWQAVAALQKAETAHKRATARGVETVVRQAGLAKTLADDVMRVAASQRLASERKIADARIGPPPLSAAGAKRIAEALAQTKASSSRKANDRAKSATRLAAVAPAERSRWRKADRVKTSTRARSSARRSSKRANRKSTKRRGKRVARGSVKKWVRRSAKRKATRRDRMRRSRRRQRYLRPRWYVVRRGDSLWRIARRFLGRGERYREIVRVNRGRINQRNLDLIYPKQRLRIPRRRG